MYIDELEETYSFRAKQ